MARMTNGGRCGPGNPWYFPLKEARRSPSPAPSLTPGRGS